MCCLGSYLLLRCLNEYEALRHMMAFIQEANAFCQTQLFQKENMAIKHAAATSKMFIDIYNAPSGGAYRFYGPALRTCGGL